ncbi:Sel1 repeat protein [Candidatus Methanoplasma termitum]|uniref:Sel1 repeat protein n=1 Tax=Candidatus Methanoplasma termitum TaxID=1577791 RepID=A0A0A7LGV9_9ARCH|nr:tetratricopeptide repeat protein [Candidatus Methanoplasma termitum]AIZ56741.1 Sel1 repeat protein [Candidatus Methanoplasma termitum]
MSCKPERKNEYTSEEVEKVKELAESGDADAQRELGLMYSDGVGVSQDDALALKWWRLAADEGHVGGQNGLGWAFLNGKGVKQDFATAVKWVKMAAEQGFAKAQMNMGLLCIGKGTSNNFEEAEKWFELASAQGYPGADRKLIEVRRRNEMTENNVKLEEYRIDECAECGRVSGITSSSRETTFPKEEIPFWNRDRYGKDTLNVLHKLSECPFWNRDRYGKDTPNGGIVSIVKTVKSSYCRHCHPEDKEAAEIRERSEKKWNGKIFSTEDANGTSVYVKPDKGFAICLTVRSDDVSISNSTGIGGSSKGTELTQDEFEEQTERFREEYDKIFNDLKTSSGKYDWRLLICKKEGAVKTNVNKGMPKEEVETRPFPLYHCAYCHSWYSTEENAKKCASSCKVKLDAELKENKDMKRKAPPEGVIIDKPWTCAYCRRPYNTERDARECAARCKEALSKDWAGKILMLDWKSKFMDENAKFKDIWVIAGEQSNSLRLDAMWIRLSQYDVSVYRKRSFDPCGSDGFKELTEDEFMEQIEQVYGKGSEMIDNLKNSRGDFDWKALIAERKEETKEEEN